ncbi:unnamed protein product, partial [Ectocarpus fasciculatus]
DRRPPINWRLFVSTTTLTTTQSLLAREPQGCGDATFIEVYAAQLPKLMTAALESHEKALKAK